MKLKNKKTGGIEELEGAYVADNKIFMATIDEDGKRNLQSSDGLAELCDEWEDVSEEPKEYWFISTIRDYEIMRVVIEDGTDLEAVQNDKEIGNYFETIEEAEKAKEKLKAWKRLQDAGLKIDAENVSDVQSLKDGYVDFDLHCYFKHYDGFGEDMDTLFRGKE